MDVNDYLENAMNGGPTLKPDEKRRYLGNFHERCYLDIEYQQLTLPYLWQVIEETLSKYEANLFMHSQLAPNIQRKIITLCQQYHRDFTLVTRNEAIQSDTVMIVYASKEAVHIKESNISAFQPKEIPQQTEKNKEKKKISFFKRLFK